METVLEARDADGELIGRCDARCHTAKGAKCTCICGGLNHGVGLDRVINSVGIFAHRDDVEITYGTRPHQTKLFTQELDEETP